MGLFEQTMTVPDLRLPAFTKKQMAYECDEYKDYLYSVSRKFFILTGYGPPSIYRLGCANSLFNMPFKRIAFGRGGSHLLSSIQFLPS
jgi:hypothetical protein